MIIIFVHNSIFLSRFSPLPGNETSPPTPKSSNSSPPTTLPPCLLAQLEEAEIVPFSISSNKRGALNTPCKLQYLGHRLENGRVLVTLSDGLNSIEVAVLDLFSIVFTKNKIAINQIVNVVKVGQRGGELTMMSFRVIKGNLPKLGDPKPMFT